MNRDTAPSTLIEAAGLHEGLQQEAKKKCEGCFSSTKFTSVSDGPRVNSSFGDYVPVALRCRYSRPRAWIISDAAIGKKMIEERG